MLGKSSEGQCRRKGGVDTRHRDSLHLCVCVCVSAAVGGILQRCWRLICGIDRRRSAQVDFDFDSDFDLDLWRVRELFDSVLVFIIFIAPHWVEELTESVASPPSPCSCSSSALILRCCCARVLHFVCVSFVSFI